MAKKTEANTKAIMEATNKAKKMEAAVARLRRRR
jgi:hypothetical protein